MANLMQMVKKMAKKVSGKQMLMGPNDSPSGGMDTVAPVVKKKGRKQSNASMKASRKVGGVTKKQVSKRVKHGQASKSIAKNYNFSKAEKKLGVVQS